MDSRRRRRFNLPKTPRREPFSPSPPDSAFAKPSGWVGGARGSFAKGNPAAPLVALTSRPTTEAFTRFSEKAKSELGIDLTNPPSTVQVQQTTDGGHTVDFHFPLDKPTPNMIARFEIRPFQDMINEVSLRVWGKMSSGEENQQQRLDYEHLCTLLSTASRESKASLRVLSSEAEVSDFATSTLLDAQRKRPCIVVTEILSSFWKDWVRGTPRVIPFLILQRFQSVADVVFITGKKSTFELSRVLGEAGYDKTFSCFDGGIRVYGPSMSETDSLLLHPLLTKFRLYKLNNTQVIDNLEAALRGVGVRVSRADELVESLHTRARPSLPDVEFGSIWEAIEDDSSEEGSTKAEVRPPLVEALERSQERYSTCLHVQKSAFKSAKKCKRQVDPNELNLMLDVLGRIAKRWKENNGALGALFADVVQRELKELQIPAKCVGNESDTTMNKLGQSRVFDGRQMQAHITYKKRDFQRCLHLFFEADIELGMVLIGYLGDHLDN